MDPPHQHPSTVETSLNCSAIRGFFQCKREKGNSKMVEITISSLPSSILESMLNVVGKRIKTVATEHFFSVIAA
uniref:Putative ovule protein n=1 Tax=Solanum chacoense TaxID=4108 RepID=A0A0V0GQD9_SOLCH